MGYCLYIRDAKPLSLETPFSIDSDQRAYQWQLMSVCVVFKFFQFCVCNHSKIHQFIIYNCTVYLYIRFV
jgi:hypothetical protein